MVIRYFSYEIMLSSGLIKLFYNTVMPCAAVLLQPTNNYIFMLCKVNLYASDTSFETLNKFIPVSNCLDTFGTLRYEQVVIQTDIHLLLWMTRSSVCTTKPANSNLSPLCYPHLNHQIVLWNSRLIFLFLDLRFSWVWAWVWGVDFSVIEVL